MRILLLEDEPEMASALKAALERRQVIVDHVSTLADAEAVVELWSYDVIVLDRRLPDGEGLSLIPGGIAHQSQEIQRRCRRAVPPHERFAALGGFDEVPLIGQPCRDLDVGRRRLRRGPPGCHGGERGFHGPWPRGSLARAWRC